MTAVKFALAFALSTTAFTAFGSNHITAFDKWAGTYRTVVDIPNKLNITRVKVSPPGPGGARTFDIWGECAKLSAVSTPYVECKWGVLQTQFGVTARLPNPTAQGTTYLPCSNIDISISTDGTSGQSLTNRIWGATCQPPHAVTHNSTSYGMRRVPSVGLPPPPLTTPDN